MALKAILTPPPIHVRRYARCGLIPHAGFESEMGSALTFIGAARKRNLFTYFTSIDDIPAGSASTRVRWRAACHTSPLLYRIRAMLLMGKSNVVTGGGGGSDPAVKLTISNSTGLTVYGSGTLKMGATLAAPSDIPSEFQWGELRITGVDPDTDVFFRLDDVNGGRLIGCSIYEEPLDITSANGYVIPASVSAQGSILDSRREDMLTLATSLWNRGASTLIHWTRDDQSSPLEVVATTLNVIDGTSTSVSAATPGWTIDTRYCRTRSKATVPCVFAAYASMSSGSGDILLKDSGGNTLATLTVNSSTAAWYTTTVDLPASLAKYDVLASNAGGDTLSVYACSLYQYA